ncbi:Transmembrane Fragile-X-F-associated protein [Zea mays]|uniref:Transmembrane Fragile-X-F-associated protein n=1 Tax=Zea mays TaxID=4577 RepID=A0A1D6I458_MAIZE|nr:Transmembrane Fragile-X-F-associated protein [Zea mays]
MLSGSLTFSMTLSRFVICSYSTFCSYPPEVVKEMPKEVLVKEVQRLQLALEEQTEMANHSQQQCDRLRNERILCRICFERDICIVMLPCRHHVLCEPCSNKCQSCPICRLTVEGRLFVYDAVMSSNPSCYAV